MNDPHVVALTYRVEHSESFSYTNAAPLGHEEPQFRIRVEERMATVEMREHFATADAARAVVETFLQAWELDAGLKFDDPNVLRFSYQDAEVIDRNPIPGLVTLGAGGVTVSGQEFSVLTDLVEYPAPPTNLTYSTDVDLMYDRFIRYKSGKTLLADTANLCLTMVDLGAGGRRFVPAAYGITSKVLGTLGDLLANKGGRDARKACGMGTGYTAQECVWIEAVVKHIIRRAAEAARDPKSAKHQITMADLPPLVGGKQRS